MSCRVLGQILQHLPRLLIPRPQSLKAKRKPTSPDPEVDRAMQTAAQALSSADLSSLHCLQAASKGYEVDQLESIITLSLHVPLRINLAV